MEKDNLYAMLGIMDQSVLTALPRASNFQDMTRSNPQLPLAAASLFACTADLEPTPINENTRASIARPDDGQLLRQVLNQANNIADAENDFLMYGSSLGGLPASSLMSNPSLRVSVGSTTATSSDTQGGVRPDISTTVSNPTSAEAATVSDSTSATSISSLSPAVTSGRWFDRFQDLVQFKEEHGHCCVPSHWPKNPPLAQWVKRQRHQFKRSKEGLHSTITPDRIDALNKMKFVWDPHSAFWEERLNELYRFREKYGHCNVPTKFPDNPQLAIWAKCQRRQFKLFVSDGPKRSNMTVDRIAKLSRVGFVFNPRQTSKRRA